MRFKAIAKSLKYGLLPSRLYEPQRHYSCSYWVHLRMNLAYAWVWLTFQETAQDIEFERQINT